MVSGFLLNALVYSVDLLECAACIILVFNYFSILTLL